MRSRESLLAWVALVGAAQLCAAFSPIASAAVVDSFPIHTHEPVLLVRSRNLTQQRLPNVMQVEPGRFVSSHDLRRACATVALGADHILMYLPVSGTCEAVNASNEHALGKRVQNITGRFDAIDPQLRAQSEPFVAIATDFHIAHEALEMCGCSVDQPPTGTSSCVSQTRTAGTAIGAVDFSASDPDTASLSSQISFQRDADTVQAGLPPELSSQCSKGTGTLQCTLTGTAPAPAGTLYITFDVSDGTYTLPLETSIQILADGDRVFSNNFDAPGCP